MARISKDELEYCTRQHTCYVCHSKDKVIPAAQLQGRGNLEVPVCPRHCNTYRSEINKARREKYATRSAAKVKARQCVSPGCHRELIPSELVPPWAREKTCGLHGGYKAFRVNRITLMQVAPELYFTEEERHSMIVQNIIYKPGKGFAFIYVKMPGYAHLKGFEARDLERVVQRLLSSAKLKPVTSALPLKRPA